MYSVVKPIRMSFPGAEKEFEVGDVVAASEFHPYLLDFVGQGAVEEITAQEDPRELVF